MLLDAQGKPIPSSQTFWCRLGQSSFRIKTLAIAFAALVTGVTSFAINVDTLSSLAKRKVAGREADSEVSGHPNRPTASLSELRISDGVFSISAFRADSERSCYRLHRFRPMIAVYDGRAKIRGRLASVTINYKANVARSGVLMGAVLGQRSLPCGSSYADGLPELNAFAADDDALFFPFPVKGKLELNVNIDSCWYPATRERLISDASLLVPFLSTLDAGVSSDWQEEIVFTAEAFGESYSSLEEFQNAVVNNRKDLNNELFLFLPLAGLTPADVPLALDKEWGITPRPNFPVLNVTFTNDKLKQLIVSSARLVVDDVILFKSATESEILVPLAVSDISFDCRPGVYDASGFPTVKVAPGDSVSTSLRLVPSGKHDDVISSNGYAIICCLEFDTNDHKLATDRFIAYFNF